MKIIKVVLLALVMMIASSCGEKKINEHRVLSKPELEIALIGNAHFVQYIEGLIEHDAQITERISHLEDVDYNNLRESTQIYSDIDEFEKYADDETVELYWAIGKEEGKISLHFGALINQLDSEFIYEKQDLFEIIETQLYETYPDAPKARLKDKCNDIYWEVYTARLNDNYYRLGMSVDKADANAVRDASWAKVGCRLAQK